MNRYEWNGYKMKYLIDFLLNFTRPYHCPYGNKWCSNNSCISMKHKLEQEQKRLDKMILKYNDCREATWMEFNREELDRLIEKDE